MTRKRYTNKSLEFRTTSFTFFEGKICNRGRDTKTRDSQPPVCNVKTIKTLGGVKINVHTLVFK